MNIQTRSRICLTPSMQGVGGMVSFQGKLIEGVKARGYEITNDLESGEFTTVLVIGGTRQLGQLMHLKRRGVRIIQRLDGMNWLHRKLRTGVQHYLRSVYGNQILALIRNHLADGVIYQSNFAQKWWERVYGLTRTSHTVIYNGVNLNTFNPHGERNLPEDRIRLLMVEGSLMGGYELGLESGANFAVGLGERLINSHSHFRSKVTELMVVGRVADSVRAHWSVWFDKHPRNRFASINWAGLVPHVQIPEIIRSAHLMYSADLNAACPNSAIEAIACGTPVVAFDTGALPELISDEAGRIVAYGGDPWKLDPPDLHSLVEAADEVLINLDNYRSAARSRAVANFDVDGMVDSYLNFLLNA